MGPLSDPDVKPTVPVRIDGRDRRRAFPNPFYVILLLASVSFVLTAMGYLVSPTVQGQAGRGQANGPGPGSLALADWLDRRGPWVLGVEFVAMFASGILAMITEPLFRPRRPTETPRTPPSGS